MVATTHRLDAAEHDDHARRVREDGQTILPGWIPHETILRWREAFRPLLDDHVAREGGRRNRGPGRYYVTLPFRVPFADPAVYADPDVLAIVDRLVGPDPVLCQLATDTPLRGSDYQEWHRDAPPLFPEWGRETPPFQLAVNFPLVDVTEANGPFETTIGTHLLPKDQVLAGIAAGTIPTHRIAAQAGDVAIRDVRAIHRGTPNTTDEPRPMVVVGFSRRWLFRPEVSIRIPRSAWATLPDDLRRLLRFNPVVEDAEAELPEEVYQSFAY